MATRLRCVACVLQGGLPDSNCDLPQTNMAENGYTMRATPANYKLNVFLIKIADSITPKDLEKMKTVFHGPGGIGMGVLEGFDTATKFFNYLKTAGMLTINNIVVLQALVWHVGRKDLYEEMVKFADEMAGVVYTCEPQPAPENGYKYTRFHLKGDLNKETIEGLRSHVADWMCVPTHLVVVAGVQPSESWIITLMVPDICATVLPHFVKLHNSSLLAWDIDRFEMDGEVITLTDDAANKSLVRDPVLVEEYNRLKKMNADLEKTSENLWFRVQEQDNVISDLRKTLYHIQRAVGLPDYTFYFYGLFLWCLCYLTLFKKSFMDGTSVGVRLKNGAVKSMDGVTSQFRSCMEKVHQKQYDGELIHSLLDSFRRVVILRHLEEIRIAGFLVLQTNMQLFVQNLQLQQHIAQLTLDNIGHLLKGGEGGTHTPGHKRVPTYMSPLGNQLPPLQVELRLAIPVEFLPVLKGISQMLKKEDRHSILKAATQELRFSKEELAYIQKTEEKFLEFLIIKKMEDMLRKSVEFQQYPEKYIQSLLKKAKRHNLIRELHKRIDEARTQPPKASPFPSRPSSTGYVFA